MTSVCFLLLGITHFCTPSLQNSPLCHSHVYSRCACIIYLVPSQKCHFLLHLPPHCCHCFGSCLSENSLVPGKHTSFPLADLQFIFLPGWNQNPRWCQLSSRVPALPCPAENNWNSATPVLFSCRNLQAHSVSCHLTNSQKTSDWLCCGSWYFTHYWIGGELIQRSSLDNNKVLSFSWQGPAANQYFNMTFFLVIKNNYTLIKKNPNFQT